MARKNNSKKQNCKSSKPRKILLPTLLAIATMMALTACTEQEKLLDADIVEDAYDVAETVPSKEIKEKQDVEESQETSKANMDVSKETSINLGNGMRITEVGEYTGIYMEDGSDEVVSGVLMIVVTNEGEKVIQYAEITMPAGEKDAFFTLSTLTPGSTVVLLEQNRMDYQEAEYTTAVAENVVVFSEQLSLCEDKLKFQMLDGVLNVSNISGKDLVGDITIYYKNSAVDVLYGGITYRVRIESGLKKDEIRQVVANHLSKSGSTIMFVECEEQ